MIKESIGGHVSPFAFAWKLIFTSITLGAGFQGGEVTPLFVIGSTLGNFLGDLLSISPSHLAALGLIGVFAGATNTPIASFILGVELFGGTGIEFLFATCAVSYFFSGHTGIYSSQKIGRSKYSLRDIPTNITLGNLSRKKKSHVLKTDFRLTGQLQFGKSSVELPVTHGLNLFRIKSSMKGLILNHHSFNPDGASWNSPPLAGKEKLIISPNCDEIYAVQVNEVYGKLDKVVLVNSNLFLDIKVNCTIVENSSEEITKVPTINDDDLTTKKLSGQFKWGTSSFELESNIGINIYRICVLGNTIRLNHSSYNADGHFYSLPPQNGQIAHRDLSVGTHVVTVDIGTSYGEKDIITIVNGHFFEDIEIQYKKINDEELDDSEEMDDLEEIVD
ncbi:Cl- channel voltage-gated family protein [Pseudobacteroides cellulosolvens ATCC 35603 = DSM 2933]|uniref:Cl-channel voltage-gated family protein n=1 Tax=Pseudobacteroides cellulosolvens ATCC 35603 = DSM 2933 TaxID=398512 RepID=A0A0L6JWB1_9FIRM|nr:Cl- channel voltage-gated family protein [Pseudobacteroides cellulosolvens ATCC 35603 = DSM 2933]